MYPNILTLANRLLELTGVILKNSKNKQVLDKLKVEQERGITVKAQSASMFYELDGKKYLLNLIDTPGHVDFSYEVSRSLAACQGTILLVDAAQGIQAQTVANFYLAFSEGLTIIPVLNKVDLPTAEPEKTVKQIESAFEVDTSNIVKISAKSAIVDGVLKKGDKIVSSHSKTKYEVAEIGIMHPEQTPTTSLHAGQVGYFVCNMKSIVETHVGDTFYHVDAPVKPLPGFVPAKSMVFAGVFPIDASDFVRLDESIKQLILNDSSVSVQKETSAALGQGFRLGFLGTLHLDVFRQRLEEEYDTNVIITHPTVPYKDEVVIRTPADFPTPAEIANKVKSTLEPFVSATIIFPEEYLGSMLDLCSSRRGEIQNYSFIDETRVILTCKLPMAEIVTDFYDHLKSRSSGFASFDYEDAGYEESSLVKMEVLLNTQPVDALAAVMHRSQIESIGRDLAKRLKAVIKKQLFEIIIQTAANGKIIARETLALVSSTPFVAAFQENRDMVDRIKTEMQGVKQMFMNELEADKGDIAQAMKEAMDVNGIQVNGVDRMAAEPYLGAIARLVPAVGPFMDWVANGGADMATLILGDLLGNTVGNILRAYDEVQKEAVSEVFGKYNN
ncbi:Translation factor guf1 mitochondrial [Mycoemilia scoparia]|uniref:Translation factor guf1 mitochondrial n=1 Tax=Mycoemilia scoparia TaxID=417184 RepID=A0A9W8A4Q4_9FUNG|nr:Translation factor guf1 mitochondrial [Mycoemilia scoparia]